MTATRNRSWEDSPLRVLLTEDSLMQQRFALAVLQTQGHCVEVANNGKEAVDLLEKQHFDLVLMDIEMPVMDGLEATGVIRKREGDTGKHIPIVALTSAADREECLGAGMDGYIAKPLSVDVLQETLRHISCARMPGTSSDYPKNQS
jgi:CheY-like chemotaxis protein